MASPVIYYLSSDEAANALIVSEEVKTGTRFCARSSRNLGVTDIETLSGRKVWWESPHIPYDGIPFVVIGTESRECQFAGSQLKDREMVLGDDGRKRRKVKPSMKTDCPARIYTTKVLKFTEWKLDPDKAKQYQKDQVSAKLRANFPKVEREYRVYMRFPALDDHKGHPIGPEANAIQRLDNRVTKKIHDLVHEGLKDLTEVTKHVEMFVRDELVPLFGEISTDNRRFYPNERTIRNHVHTALKEIEKSAMCLHAKTVHQSMKVVQIPEVYVDNEDDEAVETIVIETGEFNNHPSEIRQKCLDSLKKIESGILTASEASLPEIYKRLLSLHELVNQDGIQELLVQHLLKDPRFNSVNLRTTKHNNLVEFDGIITMDPHAHSV